MIGHAGQPEGLYLIMQRTPAPMLCIGQRGVWTKIGSASHRIRCLAKVKIGKANILFKKLILLKKNL